MAKKRIRKNRANDTSPQKRRPMVAQRHACVADFVASVAGDDASFMQEFADRLKSREVVKTLQMMRIENGTTQAEIAKEIGCSQGRISKLENGVDEDLTCGDVEAYARVLGRSVHVLFTKRNESSLDRIKRFAFGIHRELDRLAELANRDEAIAKGVAQTFSEVLLNQLRLLGLAAGKLPVDPETDEPYIHAEVEDDSAGTAPAVESECVPTPV